MSIRLVLLNLWLRVFAKPMVRRFHGPAQMRGATERLASWIVREPTEICRLQIRLAGRDALSLRAGRCVAGRVILYLHGGGYVTGSPWMYRGLTGRLAKLSGLEVIVPDYRLAPEAPVGGRYTTTVKVVDRVMDAASGTFVVRMELPNPKGALPAGLKCRARFALGEAPPASR